MGTRHKEVKKVAKHHTTSVGELWFKFRCPVPELVLLDHALSPIKRKRNQYSNGFQTPSYSSMPFTTSYL